MTVDFTQRIAILLQIIWTEPFIRSAASALDILHCLPTADHCYLCVWRSLKVKLLLFFLTAELDLSSGEGEISTKEPTRTGAQETEKGGKRLPCK